MSSGSKIIDIGLPVEKAAETPAALKKRVDEGASEAQTRLTAKQKETGRYPKGRISLHGLRIAVENPRGSVRSGTSPDGKTWSNKMHAHYGYIEGTEGKDTDPVDVFVGDEPHSEYVVVINQVDPKTKKFDEHKVLLGYTSRKAAEKCYLKNYDPGWQGLGHSSTMTMDQFKWWLENQDTKKEIKGGTFASPNLRKEAADKKDDDDRDRQPTVAVDLDGTLARHYDQYDADSIPDPRPGARKAMAEFRRDGYRIVINTVRGDRKLVGEWLQRHDIEYDYINENPDQPDGSSDKIYADVYVDDRGIDARKSWKQITQEVGRRVKAAEAGVWYTAESPIHGWGVFAGRDLEAGERIGQAVERKGVDKFDRDELELTQLGLKLNYGSRATVELVKTSKGFDLVAKDRITEGDEFIASNNYHAEHKAMGLPNDAVLLNGTNPEKKAGDSKSTFEVYDVELFQ